VNKDLVSLDLHRGMNAQKETLLRREEAGVQADQAALKKRQIEFEDFLVTKPAASKKEAAIKAKYLLRLYAETPQGGDPRRALLIARALDDLDRHFGLKPADGDLKS
jgi:hypothetical protein